MAEETDSVISPQQLKEFHTNGLVAIPDFLTDEEVASLRKACDRLVSGMNPDDHVTTTFSTDDNKQARGDYFLNSGCEVRYFFEEDAIDDNGNLKVAKNVSLNKIGHALHWLVPEFKKVSFSSKVKKVAQKLNFTSPALVQSMYIFKQPGYGGEVTPHKDSTFLSTDPLSCIGFWFALEDATLDNGCLWYSPKSHNKASPRRFVRKQTDKGIETCFTHPPDPDDPSKYIAAPVKKGTLVLIHGQVDHKSARNTSDKSRHIYTFHVIERHNTKWSPLNWLQPTEFMPFTGLYEN